MRADDVVTWAIENWPFIVALATGVATTTGWVVNVLRVRELRYQLSRLRWEATQREQRIHMPTDDEVRVFGKPRSASNLSIVGNLLAALLLLTGGGIALRHLGNALREAQANESRERLEANNARAEVVQLQKTLTQVLAHRPNEHRTTGPGGGDDEDGTDPGGAPVGESIGVFQLIDLEKEPRLLHFVAPPFPVDPTMDSRPDFIVVSVLVDAAGQVPAAEVVTEAPPDVAAAVVKAVRKWRYTPGESKTGPVATRVLQAVTFDPRL